MIDDLLNDLIRREGGFVDHPSDRGGPTRWGITEAVAHANGYDGAMESLPLELAREIYRRRYWTGPCFGEVAQLSSPIAAELFDTGVNMGPAVAAAFLQRALNALNRQGRDYRDIAVDGSVGPATLGALRSFLERRGSAGEAVLLRALDSLQGARYIELAERRSEQEDFVFGWLAHRVGAAA